MKKEKLNTNNRFQPPIPTHRPEENGIERDKSTNNLIGKVEFWLSSLGQDERRTLFFIAVTLFICALMVRVTLEIKKPAVPAYTEFKQDTNTIKPSDHRINLIHKK